MSFHEARDDHDACVVWLFTGPTNNDADFEKYCDAIVQLDAAFAGKTAAAILVVDAGNPPPSSPWRKKIADVSATLRSKPTFAMVSASPLMRGVVIAINWLRPAAYPFTVVSTFDDARAWTEQQHGHSLLCLPRLLEDVRKIASRS